MKALRRETIALRYLAVWAVQMTCAALLLFGLLFSLTAHSGDKRQKVIDFEDEVVEGLNKRPLDSLQQLSDQNRRKKPHLYRKRASFRSETNETLQTVRFSP